MYNGVGLQTPRGSGTSGFVQRNYSVPKKMRSKLEFLKELKSLRENVLPPPRKANAEILQHKQQREIYVKLEEMRRELTQKGDKSSEIEEALKAAEITMRQKFESGDLNIDCSKTQKDTHALAAIKETEFKRLQKAFDIQSDWKAGEAFDFEQQERGRLEKLYQKELGKVQKMEDDKEAAKAEKKAHKERKKEKFEEKRKMKKQAKRDELAAQAAKERREEELRNIESTQMMLEEDELGRYFQDQKSKKSVSSSSGARKTKKRGRKARSSSDSSRRSSSSASSNSSESQVRDTRRKKNNRKSERSRSRSASIKRSRKRDEKPDRKRTRSPIVKNEKKAEASTKKTEKPKVDDRKRDSVKPERKIVEDKKRDGDRINLDRGRENSRSTKPKVAVVEKKDSGKEAERKKESSTRRKDNVGEKTGRDQKNRGRGRKRSSSGSSSGSGSSGSEGRDSFDSDSSSSSEY